MIKLTDGRTFETEADYFRSLNLVAAAAVAKVNSALLDRERDTQRYPLLNIQNWSWKTYEKWKNNKLST